MVAAYPCRFERFCRLWACWPTLMLLRRVDALLSLSFSLASLCFCFSWISLTISAFPPFLSLPQIDDCMTCVSRCEEARSEPTTQAHKHKQTQAQTHKHTDNTNPTHKHKQTQTLTGEWAGGHEAPCPSTRSETLPTQGTAGAAAAGSCTHCGIDT